MGLNHIAIKIFGFLLFLPALLRTNGEFWFAFLGKLGIKVSSLKRSIV